MKKVAKGKENTVDVLEGKATQRYQCDTCKLCFDTAQALGKCRVNFKASKATSTTQKRVELDKNKIVDEFQQSQKTKLTKNQGLQICVSKE